ncbi:MAG: peptidoglycan-associated lipoprotein Pal [Alphaproteobacteria bacterium]
MFARYFMIFSALFMVSACTGNADKGGIETGMNDGVIVDEVDVYADNGPAPGTQADLVVNVGDRIFFETNSSDLTAAARTTLENQAVWLGQYSSLVVSIEGHADERGTREFNLALGERRANAVKNYLVALGVSPSRVATISYGKERPAVPGANDMAWSQNRRGVTKVQ